jgi:DNA end-binding protein Ku
MARAIWSGTVGFGLVQIPVALHSAEDKDELDMTMLDRRDFSPVGYQRINKKTGEEVPWEEIVKGHEHAPGEYVVLTDADFQAANVESTRQVDIEDFVDFSSIDPRYLDRPYYLAPLKAGKKAYGLLREVLHRTGKAGIGKIVIRTRQHLAAVVAREKVLLLVLLRFSDELRDESDLELPETSLAKLGVSQKELHMAEQLVEGMVAEFKPEKYVDEYRRDLTKLIAKKVKAGDVNRVPDGVETKRQRVEGTNVIDLAAMLAKSLGGGKKSRDDKERAAPKRGPVKSKARGGGHKKSA